MKLDYIILFFEDYYQDICIVMLIHFDHILFRRSLASDIVEFLNINSLIIDPIDF